MELPPKPEYIHNLEFVRILTPYVFVSRIIMSKSVLDVGCGYGHGAWFFAKSGAGRIVAVDLDEVKVRQVSRFCINAQNFAGFVMDAQKLGFKGEAFQVITCFEVIEHIPNPNLFLAELSRVLKPDGVLLLTTPNRSVRLLPFQRPRNPEHLREYTLRTFQKSMQKHFSSFSLLGIYGEPEPYELYRNMWRQSLFRVYLGWVFRIMHLSTPTPAKRLIKRFFAKANSSNRFSSYTHLFNMDIPSPDPENWPFYFSNVDEDCLNYLAICSFSAQIVEKAVKEIKGSL